MNVADKILPVKMTRPNLENVPEFTLPPGFALRWFQPGDEAHWLRIHLAADRFNKITPELFQRQFGSDEKLLSERQYFLINPIAEVIGTGTAWFNGHFEGGRWGRVHWMAVVPAFQRRGLGKALLSAICGRLRELGHQRAYLTTSTARLPAIRLYLQFGFEPWIQTAEDDRLWRELIPLAKR